MKNRVVFIFTVLTVIVSAITGCSSTPTKPENAEIISIELSDKEVHIGVGEEYELSAKVLPKEADKEDITWTTTNDSVIRLNQNGKIKGLEDGVAIVSVKSENGVTSESCYVYVETPKARNDLNQNEHAVFAVLTDRDVLYNYFKEPNSVTVRDVKEISATDKDGNSVTMGGEYYMTLSGENGFGGKSIDDYAVHFDRIFPISTYESSMESLGYTNLHYNKIEDLDLTRLNKALKEYFEEKGW